MKEISLPAMLLGWAVAVVCGGVLERLLRALYVAVTGVAPASGGFSAAVVVVALVAGFLAYLAGGFAASRLAPRRGGLNGAMCAVLGLVLGVILALILSGFGRYFIGAVALPPVSFGLSGRELLAALGLFLADLFGGYVGGKLGEPPFPNVIRR
ncbi:MAG: hypothetical protein K6T51_07725 [Rubrobacteraceae bacterium]|uniref:hypothetical protein n=1 Tax=Rubrobacter naiadicus TaxID=1392641 RepID=UPI00236183CB|nr:hypothetical protein [Rubrobacter naiadicus]MBX6762948.1 hypothetical protein [Rubrobacteraceae bacterium]MCL6438485.1 hypothetical protein [Rubrobacteraceae bacterium]